MTPFDYLTQGSHGLLPLVIEEVGVFHPAVAFCGSGDAPEGSGFALRKSERVMRPGDSSRVVRAAYQRRYLVLPPAPRSHHYAERPATMLATVADAERGQNAILYQWPRRDVR